MRVEVTVASSNSDAETIRELVALAVSRSPVDDAAHRALPVELAIEVG